MNDLIISNRRRFLQLAGASSLSLLASQAGLAAENPDPNTRHGDVLVYGSTPAGFCAAIGAAREGARTLLLEPTDHLGAVITGGLSFSDSNQMVRAGLRGVFEEFYLRLEADYHRRGVKLPYSVEDKEFGKGQTKAWTHEPHVAMRVMREMLAEAKVEVLLNTPLKSLDLAGTRIRSFLSSGERRFHARSYVDATYEGDLMAAAKVSWTIGREGRAEFKETLAGKQYPKGKMAFSGLDDQGNPLPLITTKDAGPEAEGDRNVMVYSFRLCLTTKPELRAPFIEPDKYDPKRFEALRRYFAWEKKPHPLWDKYQLPGGKIDANNGIGKQFSMGLVGAGNPWSEADPAARQKIWEEHKQYTLEMYRFLTTDPAVPGNIRKHLGAYGLCRDEFAAYDHWSPALYVREGRRMRGAYTLTQHDVLKDNKKPDSIALSSFPIDSHDCQRVAIGDSHVVNEGTIFPYKINKSLRAGPEYEIPYRAITPKKGECDNLLVPVALSSTHVAYSSVRVEPAWMAIGHSAGIAAALLARENLSSQDLPYPKLKERLLAQKQILTRADAIESIS